MTQIQTVNASKALLHNFERFFMAPTHEALSELLFQNNGEQKYLDFKDSWPKIDKIAKQVLAFANSGGGAIIFGVKEDGNGSLHPKGLEKFTDKSDITNVFNSKLPKSLAQSIGVYDFDYPLSSIQELRGKKFQAILIEPNDRDLPFVAIDDGGDGITKGAVFVRHNGSIAPASHDELQSLISKRIKASQTIRSSSKLKEELDQLKILLEEKNQPNFFLRGLLIAHARKGSDEYEKFISDCAEKKKSKITTLLEID